MMNRLGLAAIALLLVSSSYGCKPKATPEPGGDASTTAASSTAAATPAGVVFTKKAPAVGDKREEDENMDLAMDISVDIGNGKPNKSDMKEHEVTDKTVEVLAVTHLPQVAACADHHLLVAKRAAADAKDGGTRTESSVQPLDGEGRTREIARMLGGERVSATSLAHAREMLDRPPAGGKARAKATS